MSSRRKSTTPCMVLPSDVLEQDPDMEILTGQEGVQFAAEGPTEGVIVPLETEGEHEDMSSHPTAKRPAVEQSVSDLTVVASIQAETEDIEDPSVTGISLSKTPIMKRKPEPKKIAVSLKGTDETDAFIESEGDLEPLEASVLGSSMTEMTNPILAESAKPGVFVSISNISSAEQKKPVVNPATVLPAGLAQVLSALQAHQTAHAQLLIPVSSIPTYNAAMDSNALLVNTYKKFPYPSVSEIIGLAAQTKFSEEQIKIWFSAQRLKHGVSWTPEEVEEARRKQFNGTVHTVPQTITVIPAHHLSATNGLQSILQTCQIVGQPGLVLTQVGAANSLPGTTPITLTVAGLPHQNQASKSATSQSSSALSETKRATTVQPPSLTPQESSVLSADHFGLRPKKSKEQLAELKASYMKNHFASDAEIARLMKLTNLTKGEIKKWFSDTRYNQRNSKNSHFSILHESSRGNSSSATIVIDSSDETPQSPSPVKEKETRKTWNTFPDFTLQKFKEKTPEQLVILEESFQTCDTPSDEELSRLRAETKLTRREIDAWFTEKRKTPAGELSEQRTEEADVKKLSQSPSGGRKLPREKLKKTPEQLHLLKSAFIHSQWPTAEEYDQLAEETGLPRSYIVNWFGDTRYSWKNGNLKWFFCYQSGNIEGVNGNKGRKRRIRNRGWGRSRNRRSRKSTGSEKSPQIKFKTGKEFLKEYYLKHNFLNEQDLDELVAKSNMSYEQVREWFAEVARKVDMGADPFEDNKGNEHEKESEGENEMTVEEQGPSTAGDDCEDEDTDDSDTWEPPHSVRKTLSGSEDH
ncbi:zinc fingers and homeoboxes protein 1-like [Trichomycterus rosablanca]|uniref:zinc fingers and homeoboxes protein 1-like n=1 Tax=Trichomycterus rosablanca TaxID=2290929 RepID=UPI002F35BD37